MQRLHRRQQKVRELLAEHQRLLLLLEQPLLPEIPTPLTDLLMEEPSQPPPLTPEELEEIQQWAQRDPLEEIEERLGLSTSPLSRPTSAG
jgi:hypothetical protein